MVNNKVITALTLFELAEYLGYGEGFQLQAVVKDFAPGMVMRMSMEVPRDERWYLVLCLNGDSPSSAIAMKLSFLTPRGKRRTYVIFFHEGWIGQPVCPAGLKPIKEGSIFTVSFANVTDYTGDPEFDRFVEFAQKRVGGAKTVDFSHTCFLFKVYRDYFEKMDQLIRNIFRT